MSRFAVVGMSGAVLNSAVLFALYQCLHLPLVVASAVAVEVAVVNNYLWNDRWTFGGRPRSFRRFARFNVSSLGGLALNVVAVFLLTGIGVHFLVANLVGIGAGFGANYLLSSTWVWAAA